MIKNYTQYLPERETFDQYIKQCNFITYNCVLVVAEETVLFRTSHTKLARVKSGDRKFHEGVRQVRHILESCRVTGSIQVGNRSDASTGQ